MAELQEKISINNSAPTSVDFYTLVAELAWLEELIDTRSKINAGEIPEISLNEILPPDITTHSSQYAAMIKAINPTFEERFVLIFALAAHVKPELLDVFCHEKIRVAFGGITGKNNRGFIPTWQTALFVLAGNNLSPRLSLFRSLRNSSVLLKHKLFVAEPVSAGDSELSMVLKPTAKLLEIAFEEITRKPEFSINFPACLVETNLSWDDAVFSPTTQQQLNSIDIWIKYHKELTLDKNIGKRIKPGYRALFYGPPGTGKTLAACLIGKKMDSPVYRVDLSMVVSKYIGETEKNLARLFDLSEEQNWILFFDEADALYGKRTSVNDAHDRYANLEVSYLLQRIENYNGLVILASNIKNNVDYAFMRRFQSVVYFPFPKNHERAILWRKTLPESLITSSDILIDEIALKYELTGSQILNIATAASLRTLALKHTYIQSQVFNECIAQELAKEGKTL